MTFILKHLLLSTLILKQTTFAAEPSATRCLNSFVPPAQLLDSGEHSTKIKKMRDSILDQRLLKVKVEQELSEARSGSLPDHWDELEKELFEKSLSATNKEIFDTFIFDFHHYRILKLEMQILSNIQENASHRLNQIVFSQTKSQAAILQTVNRLYASRGWIFKRLAPGSLGPWARYMILNQSMDTELALRQAEDFLRNDGAKITPVESELLRRLHFQLLVLRTDFLRFSPGNLYKDFGFLLHSEREEKSREFTKVWEKLSSNQLNFISKAIDDVTLQFEKIRNRQSPDTPLQLKLRKRAQEVYYRNLNDSRFTDHPYLFSAAGLIFREDGTFEGG